MAPWAQTSGGVLLAIAAQPIHEGGHAMAMRLLTGAWPHVSFWAVYSGSQFQSKLDALIVLAAGDFAVLAWWTAIFLLVYHQPRRKWALVGPTFMLAIVVLNWIVSAALFPFGYSDVGSSDASKFLAISRTGPWSVSVILIGFGIHTRDSCRSVFPNSVRADASEGLWLLKASTRPDKHFALSDVVRSRVQIECGPKKMMAAPSRQTADPRMSYWSGLVFSTPHSHSSEERM